MPKQRSIGQTRLELPYVHLLRHGPHMRPPTPEDLKAPPQSSGDEEPAEEDSEFEEARPTKRQKRSNSQEDVKVESRSSSPPRQSQSTILACEPSNIQPSSWTKTKYDDDEDLGEYFSSQLRSSQPQKSYGGGARTVRNIHTSSPHASKRKGGKKAPDRAQIRDRNGFKTRDVGGALLLGRSATMLTRFVTSAKG